MIRKVDERGHMKQTYSCMYGLRITMLHRRVTIVTAIYAYEVSAIRDSKEKQRPAYQVLVEVLEAMQEHRPSPLMFVREPVLPVSKLLVHPGEIAVFVPGLRALVV